MAERRTLRFRWAGLLWLGATLIWIPFEETRFTCPILLGIWSAAWLVMRRPKTDATLLTAAGWGSLTGLLTPFCAALLIFFKSSLHAHGFFEFHPTQFAALLKSTPWWAVGGAAIGALNYLVLDLFKQPNEGG